MWFICSLSRLILWMSTVLEPWHRTSPQATFWPGARPACRSDTWTPSVGMQIHQDLGEQEGGRHTPCWVCSSLPGVICDLACAAPSLCARLRGGQQQLAVRYLSGEEGSSLTELAQTRLGSQANAGVPGGGAVTRGGSGWA